MSTITKELANITQKADTFGSSEVDMVAQVITNIHNSSDEVKLDEESLLSMLMTVNDLQKVTVDVLVASEIESYSVTKYVLIYIAMLQVRAQWENNKYLHLWLNIRSRPRRLFTDQVEKLWWSLYFVLVIISFNMK